MSELNNNNESDTIVQPQNDQGADANPAETEAASLREPSGIPNLGATCYMAPLIIAMSQEPLLSDILSANLDGIDDQTAMTARYLQRVLCSVILEGVNFDTEAYDVLLRRLGVAHGQIQDTATAWEQHIVVLFRGMGIASMYSWRSPYNVEFGSENEYYDEQPELHVRLHIVTPSSR